MDKQDLLAGSAKQQKSEAIINLKEKKEPETPPETPTETPAKPALEAREDRVEVEIREIVRIKPADFSALKNSFEAWAKTWESK